MVRSDDFKLAKLHCVDLRCVYPIRYTCVFYTSFPIGILFMLIFHSCHELWQHHRHESSSTLELAAGIFSLETNPRDYEEEAFARRMKKKKKTGRKRGI